VSEQASEQVELAAHNPGASTFRGKRYGGLKKMTKLKPGQKRMREAFALRLTDSQREFLENISEQEKIGLGEAARGILDDAMRARGIPA